MNSMFDISLIGSFIRNTVGDILAILVAIRIFMEITQGNFRRSIWTTVMAILAMLNFASFILSEFSNPRYLEPGWNMAVRTTLRISPLLYLLFFLSYLLPTKTGLGLKVVSLTVWLLILWPHLYMYWHAIIFLLKSLFAPI